MSTCRCPEKPGVLVTFSEPSPDWGGPCSQEMGLLVATIEREHLDMDFAQKVLWDTRPVGWGEVFFCS